MKNKLSEKQLNLMISNLMQSYGYFVLSEFRLNNREIDIVLLDPNTLFLTTIEIKKNKWKYLLEQSYKTKLYSHFSFAILPNSMNKESLINAFSDEGIGIGFYEENDNDIDLKFVSKPQKSNVVNQHYKKIIYAEFYAKFGELIYA